MRAVLAALGVDASTSAAVAAGLDAARAAPPVPPVVVARRSVGVRVPVGGPAQLRLEDGTRRSLATDGGVVRLPPGLPLGWHLLETGDEPIPVVITPDAVAARERRDWGWMVQLYALRSARSWGIGDLGDLATLTEWTAQRSGGLILVNPLHAVAPQPPLEASPYSPASRRWANPLYLRVEDTSWYAEAPEGLRAQVDALRPAYDPPRLDRDAAWVAKRSALELLWSARPDATSPPIPDGDDGWLFATWCALCEQHGNDWRTWPQELQRPAGAAVARARAALADRVAFHAWLQVLLAAQLAQVQHRALAAGMDVGVVHDLAVGADPAGADAWMFQDVLALDAHIGAPPDSFNQQGQDWGMPPWHPQRLAASGYAPLRDMLRSLLRHAGGVRIDHVLGMFRLWWVPAGHSARDGAYVSYDADALLGVIALEAERAGAVVVGEDLGTVPREVRRTLRDRGVLGTSVLWFEREETDEPGKAGDRPPASGWREAAMASVTTHDLPTARGWLRGEHVRLRGELGLLDDPAEEQRAWQRERAELLDLLVAEGLLAEPAEAAEEDVVAALHAYVAGTPSRYVLAAPGDAIGDLRQPNLPGTAEEYPNWRLPVADDTGRPVLLDELLRDPRVERLAADLRARVR